MSEGLFPQPFTGIEEEVEQEEQQPLAPQTGLYVGQAIRAAAPERFDPFPLEEETLEEKVSKYDPADISALSLKTRANLPAQEGEEPAYIRNTVNFLLGDEMAILGIKWDQDGLNFKVDTAIDQWVDHPIISSVALAGVAFPFVGAIKKSGKVGKLATMGYTRYIDEAEHTGRILSTDVKSGAKFRESSLLKYGDDWERLADEMLDVVDEDAAALGNNTRKYFDDAFAEKVKAMSPQKRLEAVGGRKGLKRILLEEDKRTRLKRLELTVESGNATPMQQMKYHLHKRFTNTYFHLGNQVTKQYIKNMNDFWDNAKLDQLFVHGLDEADHLPYYNFLYGRLPEKEFAKLSKAKQEYFTRTRDRYWKHQDEALQSGFISQATYDRIGNAHVAAIYKKTDLGKIADITPTTDILERGGIIRHYPKLTSPTLLERTKTTDEIIEAAARGELVVDIDDVHRTSIVKDEMLHTMYKLIRDVALKAGDTTTNKFAIKAAAYDGLTDLAKKNWIGLDDLKGKGVSERIRRMMAKSLGVTEDAVGPMPYLHQNVIDELFDPDSGAGNAIHSSINLFSLLTAMHKPAKTVFNLPSHFQNLASNLFYFMPMAGVNPFRGDVVNDLQKAHKMLWEVAKDISGKEADAASIMSSKEALRDIAKRTKVDTKFKTSAGTEFDLIDELADPRVRQILEDQAFENVEGFSSVADLYKRLNSGGSTAFATKQLANLYIKSVEAANKITNKTIKTPLLARMAAAYLAEDMVPKLGAYIQYRKRGLSIDQAVLDVGRKFPQYKTVGDSVKGARRFMFPWITFQAETARIMTNNMIDSPIASAMWLQSVGAMQSLTSGLGLSPVTPEEVQQAKTGSPFWASKPTTVVMDPQAHGTVAGGLTGGFAGGTIGALKGGALGAAIGSLSGAIAGAGIGAAGTSDEESLRAWTLDFLPHSSIMPQTDSPYVDARKTTSGGAFVQDVLKVSPLEPYSILLPVLRTAMGEDEFGNEIPTEGVWDTGTKMATQMFGMISPPWIQKYGFRVGTPDAGLYTLDRLSTATLGGTAAALAGYGVGGPTGAAVGAAFGGVLGSQVDTSRFEEDIGMRVNSKTGERGNPVFDVLFNSTTSLGKSWKATPGQKAFNEKLREQNVKDYRSNLRKKMTNAAANGDDAALSSFIQDYFISYIQQYDTPAQAQAKFTESMDTLIPMLRRHPQYKRFSEEELRQKLREASAFAIKHRTEFMDRTIQELQKELLTRELNRHKSGDAIGYDFDFNFKLDIGLSDKDLL